MNATHTPGPWTLFDLDEENPGCRWSIVKGGPLAYLHTEPCDQGQANARLIAAAPELLAALEAVEARLTKAASAFYVSGKAKDLQAAFDGWKADAHQARAILAKAKQS